MIQRIQTIFLILVAAAFGAMFLFPMASTNESAPGFFSDKEYNVTDHAVLIALAGFAILMALISIFLYKNRSLQVKIGWLLIVLGLLIPIVAYLLFINYSGLMSEDLQYTDRVGMYLPLAAILFAIIANRYIRKDEKLVRSMDRLR
jgi:peptidoglycan/LPS O-acetylase OafA/YrhL